MAALQEHIKANDLQNPKDRREILCDGVMKASRPKLLSSGARSLPSTQAVMPAKVTMFSMNKVCDSLLRAELCMR